MSSGKLKPIKMLITPMILTSKNQILFLWYYFSLKIHKNLSKRYFKLHFPTSIYQVKSSNKCQFNQDNSANTKKNLINQTVSQILKDYVLRRKKLKFNRFIQGLKLAIMKKEKGHIFDQSLFIIFKQLEKHHRRYFFNKLTVRKVRLPTLKIF